MSSDSVPSLKWPCAKPESSLCCSGPRHQQHEQTSSAQGHPLKRAAFRCCVRTRDRYFGGRVCGRIGSSTCTWEEMTGGQFQGSGEQAGPRSRAAIVETDASRCRYLAGSAICTMRGWTERPPPVRWYLHHISGYHGEWHRHRPHACLLPA
jgi:hypothetical protein